MCGRFNLLSSSQALMDALGIVVQATTWVAQPPRYNIAPSQQIVAVRRSPAGEGPEFSTLRWGLIPSWAKDPAVGYRMINARSETVATKPSFRGPLRRRRCLVAADGWYEWRAGPQGRQPYLIRRRDARPFFFAALWDHWRGTAASGAALSIESCTVLTGEAARSLAVIHPRMPVVLDAGLHERWLDPDLDAPARAAEILHERTLGGFEAFPVSTRVNNPRHDDPECMAPLAASSSSPRVAGTGRAVQP